MYFKTRVEAGQKLAEQIIKKYKGQDCAVVALSDGGVLVGAQIAIKLHCVLTMLVSEAIELPRENMAIAGNAQDGSLSYNSAYSPGELEKMLGEYHGFFEEEKVQKIRDMHSLMGHTGLIRKELLREKVVIL